MLMRFSFYRLPSNYEPPQALLCGPCEKLVLCCQFYSTDVSLTFSNLVRWCLASFTRIVSGQASAVITGTNRNRTGQPESLIVALPQLAWALVLAAALECRRAYARRAAPRRRRLLG